MLGDLRVTCDHVPRVVCLPTQEEGTLHVVEHMVWHVTRGGGLGMRLLVG